MRFVFYRAKNLFHEVARQCEVMRGFARFIWLPVLSYPSRFLSSIVAATTERATSAIVHSPATSVQSGDRSSPPTGAAVVVVVSGGSTKYVTVSESCVLEERDLPSSGLLMRAHA